MLLNSKLVVLLQIKLPCTDIATVLLLVILIIIFFFQGDHGMKSASYKAFKKTSELQKKIGESFLKIIIESMSNH